MTQNYSPLPGQERYVAPLEETPLKAVDSVDTDLRSCNLWHAHLSVRWYSHHSYCGSCWWSYWRYCRLLRRLGRCSAVPHRRYLLRYSALAWCNRSTPDVHHLVFYLEDYSGYGHVRLGIYCSYCAKLRFGNKEP